MKACNQKRPVITVPVLLLRALARGATMAELETATGLRDRAVRGHLTSLEQLGIRIDRPTDRSPGVFGKYRLKDPSEVLSG